MPVALCTLIAILIIFTIFRTRASRIEKNIHDEYWDRESEANDVRKQDLSELTFVKVPENLPFGALNTATARSIEDTVNALKDKPMVNFEGQLNTDLKLKYGAANLTLLTEYDDNYVALIKALTEWGNLLSEEGYMDEAITVLKASVKCGSDIKDSYVLLANLYKFNGAADKISELIGSAEALNSIRRDSIVSALKSLI